MKNNCLRQLLFLTFLFQHANCTLESFEPTGSLFYLQQLWSAIEDPNNPTLDEYKKIDSYLKNQRDYLRPVSIYDDGKRLTHFFQFQLLGPHEEMPLFEKHSFHITEKTKHRCILIYASGNGNYAQRARDLLKELKNVGYSGHVLLRIGGFPNIEHGGLKLCHIPYAFKLSFFNEAKRLHFKEVLWLDLAIHPLTDLDMIFSEIQRNGYFLLRISSLLENREKHLLSAAESIGISYDEYSNISHISSSILGLNMTSSKAIHLLNQWEEYTTQITPCLTWHPDDLPLSIACHKTQCLPFSWYGKIVCAHDEVNWLPFERPSIQTYAERVLP